MDIKMIYLSFSISNLFSKRFENVYSKSGKITEYKCYEFEVLRNREIIGCFFSLTSRQDHAGLEISFSLLSWDFIFNINDSRHWDSKTNTWEVYD
jgi:hypothetical protein